MPLCFVQGLFPLKTATFSELTQKSPDPRQILPICHRFQCFAFGFRLLVTYHSSLVTVLMGRSAFPISHL